MIGYFFLWQDIERVRGVGGVEVKEVGGRSLWQKRKAR